MTVLTTERLRLEPIDERHFDGLQAMNSQPEVMRFISGTPETPEQTRHMIEVVKGRWAQYGFSWWAFIEADSARLVGAGCVQYLGRDPANPHELGWRLVPDKWGQGLALEAARAMAAFAFETLGAPLAVALCLPQNENSAQVMKKLGMRYRGEEIWYERPHAVYEMVRTDWLAQASVLRLRRAPPPAPVARPD
jgi:RimJ/RimL family protein N-acetyltransferase